MLPGVPSCATLGGSIIVLVTASLAAGVAGTSHPRLTAYSLAWHLSLLSLPYHSGLEWPIGEGGLGWFEFHYFKSCLMWHFVQILGKVEWPLLRNRSSALKKGLFNFQNPLKKATLKM